MYKLVIITKSNNDVSVYETGTCEEMEALHLEKEEDYDPGLYKVDVLNEEGFSVFSGEKVA